MLFPRFRRSAQCLAIWTSVSAATGAVAAAPIPDDPAAPPLEAFIGEPITPKPLGPKTTIPHPGLAPQSTLHVDLHNSGVTDLPTPLGESPVVTSRMYGETIGTCLNFTIDKRGNLFAFCGVLEGDTLSFQVTWLDSTTLEKRSTKTLLSLSLAELAALPIDLGYMFLDAEGRMIGIDRDNVVQFIGLENDELVTGTQWDLSSLVDPAEDHIATVVPDYEGHYWFLSLGSRSTDGGVVPARIGILTDPEAALAGVLELDGEIVENGLAMGPDGVYVVSDHALYGLRRDAGTGRVTIAFRETYERATVLKPGVISYGSGSAPTLVGDDLVAITDNADDQIHLLVYDRRDGVDSRLVCKEPLFDRGASANENSVIAHGRSIVVQNWYGAPASIIGGDRKTTVPGLARFDVLPDRSGCEMKWYQKDIATPATVKLSRQRGVIYGVEVARDVTDVDAWYAFMVDFETGETKNRILLGTGTAKDILFSPTYFGPDGTLLQPVTAGIVALRDGARSGDAGLLDPGSPAPGDVTVRGGCGCSMAERERDGTPLAAMCFVLVTVLVRRRC